MIENYKIKRGLFQLGRATVKELAAFADAKELTVRNYLNSRSDLCVQESAIGGRGRGRPTNIWTVTPSGQKILRRELNQLWQLKDPELDDERAAALGRIRRSISQIAEQIGELESHAGSSELVEVLDFLEARTRAMTWPLKSSSSRDKTQPWRPSFWRALACGLVDCRRILVPSRLRPRRFRPQFQQQCLRGRRTWRRT